MLTNFIGEIKFTSVRLVLEKIYHPLQQYFKKISTTEVSVIAEEAE